MFSQHTARLGRQAEEKLLSRSRQCGIHGSIRDGQARDGGAVLLNHQAAASAKLQLQPCSLSEELSLIFLCTALVGSSWNRNTADKQTGHLQATSEPTSQMSRQVPCRKGKIWKDLMGLNFPWQPHLCLSSYSRHPSPTGMLESLTEQGQPEGKYNKTSSKPISNELKGKQPGIFNQLLEHHYQNKAEVFISRG